MILTIGTGGSGLTFLNWSIIYLRGDNSYTFLNKEVVDVTDNPLLTNRTAHGQKKDHIHLTADLKKLHLATDQSVVYIVPSLQSDLEYVLQFKGKKIIFDPYVLSEELMARMCSTLPDFPLNNLIDALSSKYDQQIVKQVLIKCNKFFTRYYTMPESDLNYFNINYIDVFQNLDQRIYDIFNYLELPITTNRVSNWLSVYNKYRSVNQNFLSTFLSNPVEIDNNIQMKIFKEIVAWKDGSYQIT